MILVPKQGGSYDIYMQSHTKVEEYRYPEKRHVGTIIDRPNRFIMNVEVDGEVVKAHCPTQGSIGSIQLSGRPVLLSYHPDPKRKLKWTAEALSYDRPESKHKEWIGFYQAASNRYVEHYLRQGAFSGMIMTEGYSIERERKLGNSRIDLKVGDTYIEVKTWIQVIEKKVPSYIDQKPKKLHGFSGGERLIKHANELADALRGHERCIMLSCYQYIPDPGEDLDRYDYGELYSDTEEIVKAFDRAHEAGVESWNCYFKPTEKGVKLISYGKDEWNR